MSDQGHAEERSGSTEDFTVFLVFAIPIFIITFAFLAFVIRAMFYR